MDSAFGVTVMSVITGITIVERQCSVYGRYFTEY